MGGAQLIAYADRLGGSLRGLTDILRGPLAGAFTGVHLLPFYVPFDGADAGFDPADHTAVDPRLGTWDDVRELARTHTVVADAVVNHISADSAAFRDWLARGDASPSAGMFLTYDAVHPDGATEAELLRTFRPRPGLPFTPFSCDDGTRRLLWTTFTSRQVDLDVRSPVTRRYLRTVLETLAANGVSVVRLDAVGFTVKTPGTDSFLTAETVAFVDELAAEARALGLEVLSEVHSSWRRNPEIARHVDRVYDFALAPLALHGLTTGDGVPLRRWWEMRPPNSVTVLDTHDGIGVADVGAGPDPDGLLSDEQIAALADRIDANSGGTSVRATSATDRQLYQVDCTFFDALARDERRHLLARALQLFTPGVPQVYYVGLLAGGNDTERAARSGEGRDVNRHRYDDAELARALERPVVQAQLELLRLRADPVFAGRWDVAGTVAAPVLSFRTGDGREARLTADLRDGDWEVVLRRPEGEWRVSADTLR